MNRHSTGSILFLLLSFFSNCKKEDASPDNRCNVLIGSAGVVNRSANTCTMKLRYYIPSAANGSRLLDSRYFTIDSLFNFFDLDGADHIITLKETGRKKINIAGGATSIVLLVNKSLSDFTGAVNPVKYKKFENTFYSMFLSKTNYEIVCGGFAKEHPRINFVDFSDRKFVKNVSDIDLQKWGYYFDLSNNAGATDLYEAVDSSLDFISEHASYANRVILILTDQFAAIDSTEQIRYLSEKAKKLNTTICIAPTAYPDFTEYSQMSLCSRTGGYYFGNLASNIFQDSYDISFEGLYHIWMGDSVYESTIEMRSDGRFFDKVTWAKMQIGIFYFNYKSSSVYFLYEE